MNAETTRPPVTKAETSSAGAAAASSGYQIERVGNQGIKLVSKNTENSYAISLLGSNAEAKDTHGLQAGGAWQKSLGVEVQGKVGDYVKTDLSTRFTQVERAPASVSLGAQTADSAGKERRALEEFSLSTQFLGDRLAVTSSRRASDYDGLDPTLDDGKGSYEQDKFTAWLWRSGHSSLSIEGLSRRVDSSFQMLAQPAHTKNEETHQLRSKLSVGRAGLFVSQHDSQVLAPDRSMLLSRQSDIETGVSLGLSDLRRGGQLVQLLPDSVWVSTNRGSVERGNTIAPETSPIEKSAIGVTRSWGSGSVNLSYWRSAVDAPASASEEAQWRGRGMDVGGSLKSGRLSVSGNLSWYTADNLAAWNNTAEGNVNGSLYLTWSRASWPKVSAGVTTYAYQAAFFDYSGLEQNSLTRYELAVDSSPLLSSWADPEARLKFTASYQANASHSQWSEAQDAGASAQNLFFGLKFTRSLLP